MQEPTSQGIIIPLQILVPEISPHQLQFDPDPRTQADRTLLGQGSFGRVYAGRYQGQRVAIKSLQVSTPKLIKSLREEAALMFRLASPHTVALHGIYLGPNETALVMEHMAGGSLFHLLQDDAQALDWPTRYRLAHEIAEGMWVLHKQSVVHRDLKSLNVLLDAQQHAKITDFGFSKLRGQLSSVSVSFKHSVGTPAYKAPEVVLADNDSDSDDEAKAAPLPKKNPYSPDSDIYAYGMILWELATRQIPFEGLTARKIEKRVSTGKTEKIPADCPPAFTMLIQACWAMQANQRPRTDQVVAQTKALHLSTQASVADEEKESIPALCDIDPATKAAIGALPNYVRLPVDAKHMAKVVDSYQRSPVPGYSIGRVEMVYSPRLNRAFSAEVDLLETRHTNPKFEPKWRDEPGPSGQWRHTTYALFETMAAPYKSPAHPHVKFVLMWHGTEQAAVEGLFTTGFANLAERDTGFFGKGIYFAGETEYPWKVYGKTLLLNWVATYSAYPVIDGDMASLESKANLGNHDAHFIPVRPQNPDKPNEDVFFPCAPDRAPYQYTELVVFNPRQCLPRYVVELQSDLLPAPVVISAVEQLYKAGVEACNRCHYTDARKFFEQAAAQGYPPAYLWLYSLYQNNWVTKDAVEELRWKDLASEQFAWFQNEAHGGTPDAQFNLAWCYDTGTGVVKDPVEAVRWYRLAADQGQADAQNNLGYCYRNGTGVAKNPVEGMRWYRLAADQGHAGAQTDLGNCYYDGTGVAKDPVEAVRWFRLAADQGHATAQSNLGFCYDNGTGVAKDPVEAVRWFRLAADQGDAEAQSNLGFCYQNGTGVAKDPVEAVRWYRLAADQGYAAAQNNLGIYYQNGTGVAKDPVEAVRWFRLAADQGEALVQSNLGVCYQNGTGVAKDPVEAVRWYRLAADQGHATAQSNLGVCYDHGTGVAKDPVEAVRWYRLAADQGHAGAQTDLGNCYYDGTGVAKDPVEAVRWFRLAADQGHATAQSNLGFCYDNGTGVAKDPVEAVRWFRLAADQGDAEAQSNLGFCYENGTGVAKDPVEAVRWYRLAADQGCATAQNNLGICYQNGTGAAKDPVEAVRWYRLAAEQGYAEAQNNLGNCYYHGTGVAKDPVEAVRWFRLAADQGHATAQSNLGFCYDNGTGVAKDPVEAVRWFRLAADQGHVGAYFGDLMKNVQPYTPGGAGSASVRRGAGEQKDDGDRGQLGALPMGASLSSKQLVPGLPMLLEITKSPRRDLSYLYFPDGRPDGQNIDYYIQQFVSLLKTEGAHVPPREVIRDERNFGKQVLIEVSNRELKSWISKLPTLLQSSFKQAWDNAGLNTERSANRAGVRPGVEQQALSAPRSRGGGGFNYSEDAGAAGTGQQQKLSGGGGKPGC